MYTDPGLPIGKWLDLVQKMTAYIFPSREREVHIWLTEMMDKSRRVQRERLDPNALHMRDSRA